MKQPLVVLKFGSSVLSSASRLSAVVHDIYRCYRQGMRVLVVVSAIGRHTDLLLDEAKRVCSSVAPDAALAQLLSTGELQSAALLAMTLARAGIPSELVDPTTMALVLRGEYLDAMPVILDIDTLRRKLAATPVLVVPGFIGRHELGGTALMGRGGSDLTAVFVADQLEADECRLVKDVDGIYEQDPAEVHARCLNETPHRFGTVTYTDALRVAEVLVQSKAIEYLEAKGKRANVRALLHDDGTEVGTAVSTTADMRPVPPLDVLLLGLGEVGLGVYEHLQELPEFFEISGILVRDVSKHAESGVPTALLETNVSALLTRPHELLVDVTGDRLIAYSVVEDCLKAGCPVVTANKRLVADRGAALSAAALKMGTTFSYSATVGGGSPMIEAVSRATDAGAVIRLRGVLNGTCNYVLDRLADGIAFDEAVLEAQERGFAESDVARDLSGQDTEDKLRILASVAFGGEHSGILVAREGLETVTRSGVKRAHTRGQVIRLVAMMDSEGRAQVAPEFLPADDFLAGTQGEENRLIINGAAGHTWQVTGKGAGRWPTAEAIIADMLDVHRAVNKDNSVAATCMSERALLDEPLSILSSS